MILTEIAGVGDVAAGRAAAPRRRRLEPIYRGVVIFVFLISTFAGARSVWWYWSQGPTATDLRIFLTGLELMRTGQRQQLYSPEAQQAAQERLFPEVRESGYLPYNHLAYELLLYWPLAGLPYRAALMLWGAVNVGLILLLAWWVSPLTKALRESSGIPILIWMLAFFPLLYTLGEGQDSVVTLLIAVCSLRLMKDEKEFLSGAALGLALFKIHLALGLAFFLFFLPRKWKGLAGFSASAALVTGISMAMVGPNFLSGYLRVIREQQSRTPWGFIPRFMPNFRGFLEWTLSGWLDVNSVLLTILLISLVTMGVTWILLRLADKTAATTLYAGSVPAVLLVSYHMHLQDLTLALLPMLLLLDSGVRGELRSGWTWLLLLASAGFYVFGAASLVTSYPLLHGALLAIPVWLLWLAAMGNLLRQPRGAVGGSIPQEN